MRMDSNPMSGIQAALRVWLAKLEHQGGAYGATTAELVSRLTALASGGKKLRAALAYWAFRGYGGSPTAPAIFELGAALELFQASALLHDDLIDESLTRRGVPTANSYLADLHAKSKWRGDGAKFGYAGALLLGDIALSLAYDAALRATRLAVRAGYLTDDDVEPLLNTFSQMCQTVFLGQFLDILAENDTSLPSEKAIERALQIAASKSASYSVEYPLRLGALLAGADAVQVEAIGALGIPLGVAFQLRDDLLGVFGDSAITGKPAGDDIRQGKRTVLIETALGQAAPDEAVILESLLGKPELTPQELDAAREIAGIAVPEVERHIASYTATAWQALEDLPLDPAAKAGLFALAGRLVDRDH
ncbi:MAG: polyprenyl synthetase family protein [Promicromonosporaceae bacterium]|nr:polyprenyl synthetase family protein [Promicromonosporaceae bacterium]